MTVVYDASVFVAAERNDRQIWADHRVRLELGFVPTTTAPVVAQVSRSHRQVQLRRLLRGCDIEAFAPDQAHEVGSLLARAGMSDVVDAHVVMTAARHMSTVLTSDSEDLRQLSDQLAAPVEIRRI
ncbi:MAG: PIN domain-containing protein [Actinomycetota bacterium]|nr:PIN domain-containing protein [Actinomycetota bacterium]